MDIEKPITFKGRARIPSPKISKPVQEEDKKALGNRTKDLPPQYRIRRFYLPTEIGNHSTNDDCWVSLFNQVYDLSKLIAENFDSPLCDPIVIAAGADITHWFDPVTREPKTFIDS
jgi:hypothetical protein